MNTETKPALAYTFRWDYIGFYHVFVIQVENKSNVRLPWFEIHFMRKDSEARVASFWLYCPNRKESFAPCDLAPGDVSIYKTHNITAETLKEIAASIPPDQFYLLVESDFKEVDRVSGEEFGEILANGP